jgi:hypothetical protein
MKTGLALKRVAHCVVVLSMFAPLWSAALAADAQSYQTAAAIAVGKLDFARAIEIYSKGLEEPFSVQERADLVRMRGVATRREIAKLFPRRPDERRDPYAAAHR